MCNIVKEVREKKWKPNPFLKEGESDGFSEQENGEVVFIARFYGSPHILKKVVEHFRDECVYRYRDIVYCEDKEYFDIYVHRGCRRNEVVVRFWGYMKTKYYWTNRDFERSMEYLNGLCDGGALTLP